jgi:hypothetical protein
MGHELLCRVRSGGKTGRGKAVLETSEIIFRGDFRLKVPFTSLVSVVSRDGELHLKWANESAVFELGEPAEKWAHKILHPKTTAEKLGIKPGLVILAVGMGDGDFVGDLRAQAARFSNSKPLRNCDLVFFGAESSADLVRIKRLVPSLSSAGALWIVYPKGTQAIQQQQVFDAGKGAGLVDVKVVRFSETHTALKFVRPKAKR